MAHKQENLDNFVQKLLKLQATKENEEALSDDDLKFIAEGMGIEIGDLEQARKDYATRATGHLQYQNWQDAIKEYNELLILSPQDANAHYGLALAYAGFWKENSHTTNKDKAIKYVEKTLILNPQHQQALKLLSQLRKKKQTFTSPNNTKSGTQVQTKVKNSIVALAITIFIAIATITFIIQNTVTSTVNTINTVKNNIKRSSSTTIHNSIAGIDDRGSVYWSIEYEQYHSNDGVKRDFFARIINPKSGKEVKKIYFAKEANITNYQWQKAEFINGKFYNFDRNTKTFEARDIHTGKIVENPAILSKKYPQLKEGIAEVKEENIWYKLILKNGDIFWYSPHLKLLYDEEAYKSWRSSGKNVSTYISYQWNFEEKGVKKRYYLFRKEQRQRNFSTYKRRPRKINFELNMPQNQRYFQSRYGTQITQEPSEWFLDSEVMYSDGEICVILHKKEIGENAPNILTAIDKKGKILWQNKNFESILLKNLKTNNLYNLKTNKYKNILTLDFPYLRVNNRSYHFMIALNLNSGKVLWEYSPDYAPNNP